MNNSDTGLLLNEKNIKLHRQYFSQMVKLLGIFVEYRAPREGKTYNGYGELDTFYYEPIKVGCIFEEHPTLKTQKKLGWNAELQTNASIISVSYDLPNLQRGALFTIPCGIDGGKPRVFKVVNMETQMIYPASISCTVVPEIENTFEKAEQDYSHSDFTLLKDEENY